MPQTLRGLDPDRLERSCSGARDSIRFGRGASGLERAEVRLSTCAFEPHRHDTYAIGVTTAGVQAFRYRGARRICLPGQLHVLHPDETHDGASATARGFAYRILYVDPGLVLRALGGAALPFVSRPVHDVTPATRAVVQLLEEIDEPLDELACADAAAVLGDALRALAGRPEPAGGAIDLRAVERVREYLDADPLHQAPAETLERLAGVDRFSLTRSFRRALGTSPDRYRTLRRLALARAAIERGTPLAAAAAETGFADQSHMTRQFKRAYGITPARWARLVV